MVKKDLLIIDSSVFFGRGIFETILVLNNGVFLKEHLERLKDGCLNLNIPFNINEEELRNRGLQNLTEVKFENSINRATAVANPRQIERAVRGSVFKLDLIYELENEQEFIEDIETLAEGMKLLQYDYLGGNGSRGYGKIQFQNIHVEAAVGNIAEALMEKCNLILNEATM